MIIKDQLTELLAIKLYEHDFRDEEPRYNWMRLGDDDRELYRRMARGEIAAPLK